MARAIETVGHLDTLALIGDLWARRDLFDAVTLRQDAPGSAHRDTRAIFLRGPIEPARWFDDIPHADYRFIEGWPSAAAALDRIATMLGGRTLGKAMIVALKPGGRIVPHIDEGAYPVAHDRYHLVLSTTPEAVLISGGERRHVAVGELVRFETALPHTAENDGAWERIHLIVDAHKP
jgi:hypothetical protein